MLVHLHNSVEGISKVNIAYWNCDQGSVKLDVVRIRTLFLVITFFM